jgi:hypothetical protein
MATATIKAGRKKSVHFSDPANTRASVYLYPQLHKDMTDLTSALRDDPKRRIKKGQRITINALMIEAAELFVSDNKVRLGKYRNANRS